MKSLVRHQEAWFRSYGWECLFGLGLYLAVLVGSVALAARFDAKWFVGLALAAVFGHAVWWLMKNRRTITVDELEAILPALDVSENARLYAEVLLLVYRTPLDPDTRREALDELKGLMAQDEALVQARSQLVVPSSGENEASASDEVRRLEGLRDSATDPHAKSTYEQGLAMALERAGAAERHRPYVERIDAEREVVRQALLRLKWDLAGVADSAARLPIETLPTLRRSTSSVREHAEAIERAVEELGQG